MWYPRVTMFVLMPLSILMVTPEIFYSLLPSNYFTDVLVTHGSTIRIGCFVLFVFIVILVAFDFDRLFKDKAQTHNQKLKASGRSVNITGYMVRQRKARNKSVFYTIEKNLELDGIPVQINQIIPKKIEKQIVDKKPSLVMYYKKEDNKIRFSIDWSIFNNGRFII